MYGRITQVDLGLVLKCKRSLSGHAECRLLWGKHEGDGMQLTLLQSMGSGFSAACLGPVCTGPFDVIKVSLLVP